MEYPEKFTLVITEEHLDRGIREVWDMKQDVCENCAIAMAAKDKFGDMFQGMGYTHLQLFGPDDKLFENRIAYHCGDAPLITNYPISHANRALIAKNLPLTLTFAHVGRDDRPGIWSAK